MPSRRSVLQGLCATMALSARAAEPAHEHGPGCVFCDIVAGRREATLVWSDARCLAVADRYPLARGHTLLLPREHVADLYAMPPDLAAHLFGLAPRLAREIKRAFAADGMTLVQNNERHGGQTVFHFHLHFVPRTAGVRLFEYPAERPEAPREVREREFAPLRAALSG